MTGDHGPFTHSLEAWLDTDDDFLDPDAVLERALEQVETKPQRRADSWQDWRSAVMNKTLTFVAAAAAVVLIGVIGFGALGGNGFGSPDPSVPDPTATPQPTTEPTPSPSVDAGLPEGPYAIEDPAITVTVASPGWVALPQFGGMVKSDDGLDPPEGTGVALLAGSEPTGLLVYGDPCHWSTSAPDSAATTVDDIVAALAAQPDREATEPVDVTVDGYAGKSITLQVPMLGPDRDTAFADCDQNMYASYAYAGETQPARQHQGPGQVDQFWILDVDGTLVILDAMWGPATPDELVEEVRTLAESATFDLP